MLSEYKVDSPAKLSHGEKKEFFTRIKNEWKERKSEVVNPRKKRLPSSKKSQYAKVRVSRPSVALEPKVTYPQTGTSISEDVLKKILSEANPEQTDELQIRYLPNGFFEQENLLYTYPVVKMPQQESFLKLPRKGRGGSKGYKERDFHQAILAHFPEVEVSVRGHDYSPGRAISILHPFPKLSGLN